VWASFADIKDFSICVMYSSNFIKYLLSPHLSLHFCAWLYPSTGFRVKNLAHEKIIPWSLHSNTGVLGRQIRGSKEIRGDDCNPEEGHRIVNVGEGLWI
jgi:hypothetical protein